MLRTVFSGFDMVKNQYFAKAKDLTGYLPQGYSKNGDTDYTSYIQQGINENSAIIMPDFPILINEMD